MSVAVREADLESDGRAIIDIFRQYLNPLADRSRFDWLYNNNPHGQARVWFVYNTADETIIGMAGAFPRRVYVNGGEELSWVLGDFCISDDYRSLGPALMLQRACLAGVESGNAAFCYDFPSASMMAVYKRLRIDPFGRVVRMAKPVRIDRRVNQLIKNRSLSRVLSSVGNVLLRVTESKTKTDSTLETFHHEGDCEKEFSKLAWQIGSDYGICTQRSAEYLNWRYVQNPLYRYELFTARRAGELLGFAVFLQEREDAILVDLFGIEPESVLSALIAHGVRLMTARGVQTVSAAIIETHPWRALLENQGFEMREVSPMVVYAPSGSESRAVIMKGQDWLFMHGDRDS